MLVMQRTHIPNRKLLSAVRNETQGTAAFNLREKTGVYLSYKFFSCSVWSWLRI